jgi:hypothetical protein
MTMTSFAAKCRILLLQVETHGNSYVWVAFVIFLPTTRSNTLIKVLIFQCPCPVQITNVTETFVLQAFSTTDITTSTLRV